MSIVFPPNPSLGQTYTYSNITWEYNGFGWNKLTYIPDPLYIEHLNVDFIDFDTTVVGITQQDGRMYWDSNLHTVVLGMTGGINTAIGQSLYKFVHNGSGGPINKGQVVYISGGHASTSLNIELANATSEMTAATTIGVAAENIANGADGFIITQGLLLGVDTNAFSPSDEGEILWLAETDGAFTLTRPQAPSHGVVVGWLVKKAGAGAGSIFVKISNGQEFYELHDVRFTGLTTDNIPAYKGASGIWVNKSLFDLNVARTNEGNTFSVRQVMSGGITTANLFVISGATFNSTASFNSGITTSNLFVSRGITLQNGEYIRNSTIGMVDIMPGSTATSRYGLRVDTTSWAFGVKLDPIRGDGVVSGDVWFGGDFTLTSDKNFKLDTSGAYRLRTNTGALDTMEIITSHNTNTSGTVAIKNAQDAGGRAPGVTHPHPNLYIYSNDQVDTGVNKVNSFIRFQHDGANGLMQSGGTSGILIVPGSGILGISGGISASQFISTDSGYRYTPNALRSLTGTTYTFLTTDDGKILTFNNSSAVTVTIPTGLPIGFNCTAIQLGAGQVGFTTASGVTLQSYNNQFKIIGQHGTATLIEYANNIVNISGNLTV